MSLIKQLKVQTKYNNLFTGQHKSIASIVTYLNYNLFEEIQS